MILADDSWLAVRTTQGVTAFVGAGNKPTPISEKEVDAIRKFMEMEAPRYKAAFVVSEAVKSSMVHLQTSWVVSNQLMKKKAKSKYLYQYLEEKPQSNSTFYKLQNCKSLFATTLLRYFDMSF